MIYIRESVYTSMYAGSDALIPPIYTQLNLDLESNSHMSCLICMCDVHV